MAFPMSSSSKAMVLKNIGNQEVSRDEAKLPMASVKRSSYPRSSRIKPQRSVEEEAADCLKKQKRLLRLSHASTCSREDCCVFPHCMAMKRLFIHVIGCSTRRCEVPGCKKNLYVWKHYQSCKNATCRICSPLHNAAHE